MTGSEQTKNGGKSFTLRQIIDRAKLVCGIAVGAQLLTAIVFGGEASALLVISAVIGGISLQVALLAAVANAMVDALKKKKEE